MKKFYTSFRQSSDASYRPIDDFEDLENKPQVSSKITRFFCKARSAWVTTLSTGLLALVLFQQYWIIRLHYRSCPNTTFSSSEYPKALHDEKWWESRRRVLLESWHNTFLDGLSLTLDREYRASAPTKFTSPNLTEAHEAWGAVEAGHGDVLIDPEYAAERGLPPSIPHPRNPAKLLYIIESYHAIHCIVSSIPWAVSDSRDLPCHWLMSVRSPCRRDFVLITFRSGTASLQSGL